MGRTNVREKPTFLKMILKNLVENIAMISEPFRVFTPSSSAQNFVDPFLVLMVGMNLPYFPPLFCGLERLYGRIERVAATLSLLPLGRDFVIRYGGGGKF